MDNTREVLVWLSLEGKDLPVGRMWFYSRKGRQSASFEYDRSWLAHPEKFALDPALQLSEGIMHTAGDQKIFGAIDDSAPDRWGRMLMRRAARIERQERTLLEADYLLGVSDEARLGALRFSGPEEKTSLTPRKKKVSQDRIFLAPGTINSIPPLIKLPVLLSAAEKFVEDRENHTDLRILLAPGSSLGGARPKASVRENNGSLAIAKFPRKDDEYSITKWEAVALTLAKNAGISVPEWRVETILGKPVLIVKRFDRNGTIRIPFLSAMSMLGAHDMEQHSYTEIAEVISRYGAQPNADMQQLWRRLVFNILISNTDDHLRNHGFLYTKEGWVLSPVYDINPVPIDIKARMLETAIIADNAWASLDTALSVAKYFRMDSKQAQRITSEVYASTSRWRETARLLKINVRAIDRMASAFEHEDAEKARKIADRGKK